MRGLSTSHCTKIMSQATFTVGMKFNSFEELEHAISNYENSSYCNLYKHQARTISNIKGRITKSINPLLRYYEITYHCIFGGKNRCKKVGQRNTTSLKNDCPVKIRLRVSVDGLHLEIRGCILDHNHDCNEIIYRNCQNKEIWILMILK